MELTPEEKRKLSQRNWALAGMLVAFIILVFLVTVVKLGGSIAQRTM
jgi:Na+-transporting methylmalonyl-CoA/oxaloacetate decarboxylase gamma subunit